MDPRRVRRESAPPIIYYPQEGPTIPGDVVLNRPGAKTRIPRGVDLPVLVENKPNLIPQIITGTTQRIQQIEETLGLSGPSFYARLSNHQKFDSLTASEPKLIPEADLKARLTQYRQMYRKGLSIVTRTYPEAARP